MSTIHRPISTFIPAQNLTFLQPFYKIVATQTAIKQLTLKLLSLSAFRSDSKLFKVFENARNTRYSLITSSNIGIAAAIFLLPRFDAVNFSGRPLRVADDSLWFNIIYIFFFFFFLFFPFFCLPLFISTF